MLLKYHGITTWHHRCTTMPQQCYFVQEMTGEKNAFRIKEQKSLEHSLSSTFIKCIYLSLSQNAQKSESDVTYGQVWWPILGMRALH